MLDKIIETFKFLAIEVRAQTRLTSELLDDFSEELFDKLASKDDHIDNLKAIVENECFSQIHGTEVIDSKEVNDIRAIHVICVNLERIADFCVNAANQMQYLTDNDFIHDYDYKSMFTEIRQGLSKVILVFQSKDLGAAIDICRAEYNLDRMYKENFDRMMALLEKGKNTGNLVTVIFIFRYLERIGDSLLNIGEALIFSIIGDRIKIRQIEALEKTLSESGFDGTLADIDFSTIWGSRSGCRISKVDNKSPSGFKAQGIFKEGDRTKVKKEKENIVKWDEIQPNLAPKVFGYYERKDKASLLVEFFPGCTLQETLLSQGDEIAQNALFILDQTIEEIWEKTKKPNSIKTDYMSQLSSRLDQVIKVHPGFYRHRKDISGFQILSTRRLIIRCGEIENQLEAPFTVFIHGDFNVNNIYYDNDLQRVNYIDLYRSADFDYIQDASVFLVSNFRLPVTERRLRNRLNSASAHFFHAFKKFAETNNDTSFEIRMALALARSFYTSSRFEMNIIFAKEMYLRAQYLLEKVAGHGGKPWEDFKLPQQLLFL